VLNPSQANLNLDAVLRDVDRAFPKLMATRLEAAVARAKSQEKRGAFDPVLSFDTEFLRYNSSSDPGKAKTTSMSDAVVEVLDRSGVKFSVGGRLNRGAVKSPASFTGSSGEYFVSAKIPLLRDRINNAKTVAEQQALLGEPIADQFIREAQLGLFEKAGAAYWELVGAKAKLDVATRLLKVATDRAEYIRERIAKGANPPIDQREANAEVATGDQIFVGTMLLKMLVAMTSALVRRLRKFGLKENLLTFAP
jgi:outer membrane protein TolC